MYGGGRAAIKNINEPILAADSCPGERDGILGFLRGYIAFVGARSKSVPKASLSDFNFVFANPKLQRFFSSEAPKKKSNVSLAVLLIKPY